MGKCKFKDNECVKYSYGRENPCFGKRRNGTAKRVCAEAVGRGSDDVAIEGRRYRCGDNGGT